MSTTIRLLSEPQKDFCLIVDGDRIVFAGVSSGDQKQVWFKNDKYGQGKNAFALVHKQTHKAMKIAPYGYPVDLVTFDETVMDETLLWTIDSDPSKTRVKEYLDSELILNAKDGAVHAVDIDKLDYTNIEPRHFWELKAFGAE